jgi:hypothetical protein
LGGEIESVTWDPTRIADSLDGPLRDLVRRPTYSIPRRLCKFATSARISATNYIVDSAIWLGATGAIK